MKAAYVEKKTFIFTDFVVKSKNIRFRRNSSSFGSHNNLIYASWICFKSVLASQKVLILMRSSNVLKNITKKLTLQYSCTSAKAAILLHNATWYQCFAHIKLCNTKKYNRKLASWIEVEPSCFQLQCINIGTFVWCFSFKCSLRSY